MKKNVLNKLKTFVSEEIECRNDKAPKSSFNHGYQIAMIDVRDFIKRNEAEFITNDKNIKMYFDFIVDKNGINANFKFNAQAGNKFEDIFNCLEYAKECIDEKITECTEKMINQIENN